MRERTKTGAAKALLTARRPLELRERRSALLGAAVTLLLLVGVWIRQVAVVDAERIRALFDHVG